ncbi:MAG: HXXEE domain-containing protein [Pseudomonadota bacterium]
MKVGTLLASVVLFMQASESPQDSSIFPLRQYCVWMFALYVGHQFEEHWIDLLGNQYAFYTSFNTMIANVLGEVPAEFEVLTPLSIFVINTSLVWLVGFLAIYRSEHAIFPSLAMNAIILVNAVTHVVAAIASQSYNPGLLTAVLLFLPFSIVFYIRVRFLRLASRLQVALSLVWAILGHVIMISGMLAANVVNIISETTYFVFLVGWSVVPVLVFTRANHREIT